MTRQLCACLTLHASTSVVKLSHAHICWADAATQEEASRAPVVSQSSRFHATSHRGYQSAHQGSTAVVTQADSLSQQAHSLATAVVSMRVTEVAEEETTMCLRDQLISRCVEQG